MDRRPAKKARGGPPALEAAPTAPPPAAAARPTRRTAQLANVQFGGDAPPPFALMPWAERKFLGGPRPGGRSTSYGPNGLDPLDSAQFVLSRPWQEGDNAGTGVCYYARLLVEGSAVNVPPCKTRGEAEDLLTANLLALNGVGDDTIFDHRYESVARFRPHARAILDGTLGKLDPKDNLRKTDGYSCQVLPGVFQRVVSGPDGSKVVAKLPTYAPKTPGLRVAPARARALDSPAAVAASAEFVFQSVTYARYLENYLVDLGLQVSSLKDAPDAELQRELDEKFRKVWQVQLDEDNEQAILLRDDRDAHSEALYHKNWAKLSEKVGLPKGVLLEEPCTIDGAENWLWVSSENNLYRDTFEACIVVKGSVGRNATFNNFKDAVMKTAKADDYKILRDVVKGVWGHQLNAIQQDNLVKLLEGEHVRSAASDHLINLVFMPKFMNQHFNVASNMRMKWRWTTKMAFDAAGDGVYKIAAREAAVLGA